MWYDNQMYYLINPGGRIVEVDTEKEFEKWQKMDGFVVPTKELVEEWLKKRRQMIWELKNRDEMMMHAQRGVYLMTVSQGGKDGYGVASRMIMEELGKLGIVTKNFYAKQDIGILFHNPYSILSLPTPYKIIYTMFESDKIPDDWVSYLHDAHLVIVPSRWCQEVFKKAGIDSVVVPLGYDQNVYKPIERENKRKKRKDFVFLHYNAFNIRKGFLEVFKAFNKAFEPGEPVKLVLKTVVDRPFQRFPVNYENYPNIKVVEGKLPEQQLYELMKESDCFVFPSRGEGFGMTPIECMATGMPAIVPNAHGISEYFNPDCMYEVKVGEKCPGIYSRYKGVDVGNMVVCDVDHLAQQMRYVYEHQDEAMEKGKLASEYVKKYSFEETARQLKSIIDDIKSKPLPRKKIVDLLPLKAV
jgi:glycosyltransferase involved in cell wall biosynthesis